MRARYGQSPGRALDVSEPIEFIEFPRAIAMDYGCYRRGLQGLGMLLLAVMVISCSDARLGIEHDEEELREDNLLSIHGEYCTEPSDDITFPVKVVFVLDQSASLQCLDPEPARFQALQEAVGDVLDAPDAELAFIGFSNLIRQTDFTRDYDEVQDFIEPGNHGLRPATDYQGALTRTLQLIEEDARQADARERARTRYIVHFVSDGIPEPRCTEGCDDSEPPDSLYGVCNYQDDLPEDEYVELTPCQAYNQPEQIMGRVEDIMELEDLYGLGNVTLNTTLLFSTMETVIAVCGDVAEEFGYHREEATGLLRQMANAGEGVFRDVNLEETQQGYLPVNLESVEAEYGLSSLIAHNFSAIRTTDGLKPDSDRDGLHDELERELGTDPYDPDTDGDGYSDFFEWVHADEGFEPTDEDQPALTCGNATDRTGDGLAVCEEQYLGTDPTSPDTSGDGLPDGLKFRLGLDPLVDDRFRDDDFDGVTNVEEVRGGTHPQIPSSETHRAERILYSLEDRGLEDVQRVGGGGTDPRRCYDFEIDRIAMASTSHPDQRGVNRIKLFAEDRLTELGGIGGLYKVACFEGYYDGETRYPENGLIDVTQQHLEERADDYYRLLGALAECGYFDFEEGELPDRDEIEEMVGVCMPPRIELDGYLFDRDEVYDLLDRHVDSSATLRIPELGYGLFVPMGSFNPDRDCHRPWERRRLEMLFDDLIEACETCQRPDGGD